MSRLDPKPSGVRKLMLEDIPEIVRIHQMTLPVSPFVQMGREFLERLYYPSLMREPSVFCLGYQFQNRLARFLCGSSDAGLLSWRLARSNLLKFLSVVVKTVWQDPKKIGLFLELVRFVMAESPKEAKQIKAQLLSFAVDEEFRSLDFYKRHPIKIANLLFDAALSELRQMRVTKFKLITDAKNIANIFYKNRGMKVIENFRQGNSYSVYVGEIGDP